jgi:hypothetical protein
VTEEQFLAYQQTGVLPDDDTEGTSGDLLDDFADDEPDDIDELPTEDGAADTEADGAIDDEESDDESDTDARRRTENGDSSTARP